jgi:1-deoxy-D-xylulose-5-phosphate reductoisomerase
MKLPIAYALGYPERVNSPFDRFDFMAYPTLTFEQPDYATFRNLALAYEAGKQGGTAPAVLNAANEVAVARFLRDEIEFLELTEIVEDALARVPFAAAPDLEGLLAADAAARRYAAEWTPLTVKPS